MADKIKTDPRTVRVKKKESGREIKSPYDPDKIKAGQKALAGGGRALRGYGKAYMKGGKVK